MNLTKNELKARDELKATFERSAKRISKKQAFQALVDAVCAKIDKSTLSVATQATKHAKKLFQNVDFIESIDAYESVTAFFASAKNIKAIAYIAMMSENETNNVLKLAVEHIASEKNVTTESVSKCLKAHNYSDATASAQKSMSVNALRALRAIAFDDTTKASISKDVNFDMIRERMSAFQLTR